MKSIFAFIKSMYSSDSSVSSKRVFGSIAFMWYLLLVTRWHQVDQLSQILFVSCALIGLETLKNFVVKTSKPAAPVEPGETPTQ